MCTVMFQHPFGGLVVGGTGCGKTTLVKQLLLGENKISPEPDEIYWFYVEPQPQLMQELCHKVHFVEGLPDNFEDYFRKPCRTLVILDDMMSSVGDSKQISDLYTRMAHHTNTSVLTILQNLYFKAKFARNIHLNSQYMIIFKNPRDKSQIKVFARQMYPDDTKYFMDAYTRATSKLYGYLMIDLHPTCDDKHRLKSDLSDKYPTVHAKI